MATDLAALRTPVPPTRRDIPHTVSPGLWTLGWRRLRSDRVAMVSLVIVAFFIVMMILSATGLVARHWAREFGVNNPPPTWAGAGPVAGPLATWPRRREDASSRRRKNARFASRSRTSSSASAASGTLPATPATT